MNQARVDIEALAERLRAMFSVQQVIPFEMALMIAHLHRAETRDCGFEGDRPSR